MVDPMGIASAMSKAMTARRSEPLLVVPTKIYCPAPLLTEPELFSYRVLSFRAFTWISIDPGEVCVGIEVAVGVGGTDVAVIAGNGVTVSVEGIGVEVAVGTDVAVAAGTDVCVGTAMGKAVDVAGAEVAVEVRVGVTEVVADAVDVGDGVAVGLVEPPHATNSIISTPQYTAKGLLIEVFISESSTFIF